MQRRDFISNITAFSGTLVFLPEIIAGSSLSGKQSYKRYLATTATMPNVQLPSGKRIPLGWKAFPVPALNSGNEDAVLRFPKIKAKSRKVWLRITAAIDVREEILLAVYLPNQSEKIGLFDIRYAHPFQPFELPIDSKYLEEIARQGIGIKMIKGSKDAWFFQPDTNHTDNQGLQPHLLIGESRHPSFQQNLLSMNSFSPFGWMGGCVQDGLWEMTQKGNEEALLILRKQLNSYLDREKGIVFESPMTEPRDGKFNSIEDFLPFPAIIGLYPDHPSIDMALGFLKSKENKDGMIVSGNDITTEGCYTVAYPLTVMGVARNNEELVTKSLDQLRFRTQFLTNQTSIFQRSNLQGHQSFANWGRGVAWYLLGLAKTLAVVKNSQFKGLPGITEMEDEFKRAMVLASRWQSDDGLWFSFTDRPETGIDTSGSAGIATAMGWGVKLGLLDDEYQKKAGNAYQSLLKYLTPDGFLTHVSQINRGGEELQANGYRVISQFGMGLLAQLECVLAS